MKQFISIALIALGLALSALAQQVTVTGNTNTPWAPVNYLFSILPVYDPTLTNTFNAKEVEVLTGPLWKSMTASGNTPYFDVAANYFPFKWLGVGGEAITLGNGEGDNTLDSILGNVTIRKDFGNMALGVLASGGYNWNDKAGEFAIGPLVAYRYQTKLGVQIDTRWAAEGGGKSGWLTRIMATWNF